MLNNFNPNSSFIFNGSKKSFDNFLKDIYSFSKHLKSQYIEIFTNNSYLFMVAFFGAILNKSKPYLLSYNLPSKDRAFFDDESISSLLSDCSDFDSTLMKLDLDSVFFIQTSGSSGNHKNIEKSINQMIKEATFLSNHFNIKSNTTILSSISHQHLFGLTFKIFVALKSGVNIDCQTLNYPELLSANIANLDSKNHKIILLSSPVLLDSLSKKNNIDEFNKITTIFTAGSKLNESTRAILNKLIKSQIIEIYGSSETGVIASNIDGAFRVFPDVKISHDDKSRLIVRSPWQDCEGGFLSNDCVEIEGGRLKIIGRYDRIIKLHDKRLNLDELENIIKKSPIIEDVAISQDDRYKRLAAILVLNKDGKNLFRNKGKKEIIKQINTLVTKEYNSKLRYFYIRSKLPKNTNGKLPKNAVLDSINAKIKPQFKLVSKDANSLKLNAYIDEGSFYFNGHFLDYPLVPGFIQLGFVFNAIKEHLGLEYENIKHIETIKFMNFLRPCDEASLEIKTTENKLYFKIFANDKECSNGRLKINI